MSFPRALSGHSRILTRQLSSPPTRRLPIPKTIASSKFHTSAQAQQAQDTVNSATISTITHKESELTGQTEPVKRGPTAQAQKHANEPLTPNVVSDIAKGESHITGQDGPVAGGPAAFATSKATPPPGGAHTGTLDSQTISRITQAEREITGRAGPVSGGPTARAQQHAGERIGSESLRDVTEGEKRVTGGERLRGGPTAAAQSELSKSRS